MKYHIGDKFLLNGIECKVSFINHNGEAYLTPEMDGEVLNGKALFKGLVFAIVNSKGRDSQGNALYSVVNRECEAV